MGHTEISQTPRKGRNNSKRSVISRLLFENIKCMCQREITRHRICVIHYLNNATNGRNAEHNNYNKSNRHNDALYKVSSTCG